MSNIFQWQLHGDGKTLAPGEVVEPDERLTWVRTAGIGAQHVIAMFGATFLVPILTGFDPSTTLFFTAMSTALFLLINRNVLPSYLGSSFGFIAPITAVSTANKGIAVASFGIMVTGILLALVGVLVHYAGSKWIDIIMPPVVNGAIVAIIGFNLAPSVWTNFQAAPDTALVTLLAVLLVAVLFKGLLGRLNILVGVIIGYVYAASVVRSTSPPSATPHGSASRSSTCRRPISPSFPCSSLLCLCLWLRTLAMSSPWPK